MVNQVLPKMKKTMCTWLSLCFHITWHKQAISVHVLDAEMVFFTLARALHSLWKSVAMFELASLADGKYHTPLFWGIDIKYSLCCPLIYRNQDQLVHTIDSFMPPTGGQEKKSVGYLYPFTNIMDVAVADDSVSFS